MKIGLQLHKRKILLKAGKLKRDERGNLIISDDTRLKSVADLFGDVEARELETIPSPKRELPVKLDEVEVPEKPKMQTSEQTFYKAIFNHLKIKGVNYMSGWKTWLAFVSAVVYAIGGFIAGSHDAQTMIQLLIGALAIIGIGHKVEKATKKN